jgi:hypothetical protein
VLYGFCALLVIVGVAVAVIVSSTAGQVVGFALSGIGLVLATSLVFYEVGLSEDRERAREQAAREAEAQRREGDAPRERERPSQEREHSSEREGAPRTRLPRSRGRRRRIS